MRPAGRSLGENLACLLERDRERDEQAERDAAAREALGGLACPDEHRQLLLLARGREAVELGLRDAHRSVAPDVASAAIENWLNGTAVRYTSAPCTGRPPQAVARKCTWIELVPRVTTAGAIDCWSSSRLAGDVRSAIWIVPCRSGSRSPGRRRQPDAGRNRRGAVVPVRVRGGAPQNAGCCRRRPPSGRTSSRSHR